MVQPTRRAHNWARGLGWFSIALGAAQLLAAKPLARNTGLGNRQALMRTGGVREVVGGVGLLAARNPEPWLWMRVAGDAMDLAALSLPSGRQGRTGNRAALVAVVAMTVVDVLCARSVSSSNRSRAASARLDYSRRSGWPMPADAMRGAATAAGFQTPRDMRTPDALRPWTAGKPAEPDVAAKTHSATAGMPV